MDNLLSATKQYDPRQFGLWRVAFGTYLTFYAVSILPYASELYSTVGMIPDEHLSWVYGFFPSIFFWFDSPHVVQLVAVASIFLSVSILVGFQRRIAALGLWFLWASFVSRNVLTLEPSLPFIGWLLLALVIIPEGEAYAVSKSDAPWYMPASIYWGAWLVLAVMFTISGIDKFASPSWQNGLAVKYMIEQPFADGEVASHFLRLLPTGFLKVLSWLAAGTMLATLPLIFVRQTRVLIWCVIVGMFCFADVAFGIPTQIILGMMLYYAFLFDSGWMPVLADFKRHLFAKWVP